jgi:hypothetical protein
VSDHDPTGVLSAPATDYAEARQAVRDLLAQIVQPTGTDWVLRGAFFALSGSLWLTQRRFKFDHDAPPKAREDVWKLLRPLMTASDNLAMIFVVAYRLDWCNKLRLARQLDPGVENTFSEADIFVFYAQIRSLFDHLCAAISRCAKVPGQAPSESFNDLRIWVLKNPHRATRIFDQRLVEAVASCGWFVPIRNARDKLIHQESTLMRLNSNDEHISFLIDGPSFRAVPLPAPMRPQGHGIDFRQYAAAVIARTFAFMEAISAPIRDHEGLQFSEPESPAYYLGAGIVRKWLELLDTAASDEPAG